ncbi:MAG: FtsX-like permease family protein [Betaproteobacteria bacterium]
MLRFLPLALAPVRLHKGRALASMLAIALGVAMGYAIQIINRAALAEMEQAVQTLSGAADLEVRGPRAGFDETIYARLARMPGIAVASPVLELELRVVGADATADKRDNPARPVLRVLGLDAFRAGHIQPELIALASDAQSGAQSADSLDMLRPDTLFLSPAAANALALKPGDTLALRAGLGEKSFRIAGLLAAGGERYAVMDIAAAQEAFGVTATTTAPGLINRIDLRLRPGADAQRVREAIAATLPAGLFIEAPRANVTRNATLTRAYRVNLNVLALMALFTGGFLVFSTQALTVVQRRSQLALLRVLGVTRRGLAALLLAEAAVIGLAGALAGLALGHGAASLVLARFGADLGSGFFRGLQPELHFEPDLLLLFLLLGLVAALAGSLAPALEAAQAAPAQALKAGDEQQALARLRRSWPGLVCLVTGALLTLAGPVNGLPLAGYLAIALVLFGTVLLMPRMAALVFARLPAGRGVAIRLARLQLAASPGQATVSLAAIVASFSLMVAMAIMVSSFRQSLDDWLGRVLPAELYLRVPAGVDGVFISPEEQRRIAALPELRRVDFMRAQQILLAEGRPRVTLLAREIDAADPGRALPLISEAPTVKATAADPPVWVSEAAVDLYGLQPGNTVELPIAGRMVGFRVAGVWRDYARQQGALVIERGRYIELSGDALATDAALLLAPGASADAAKKAIRTALGGDERMEFGEPGEIRALSLRIFDRTFAVTYALEASAVLIGLFGLSTSFGALVLARRREFGMLRHVGMTRRQIAAMIAHEGLLVSGLGLAVGLALGWVLSLILVHVINRQSFHWGMDIYIPWDKLGLLALALLVLAVLTALISARRALSGEAVRAVREDW